MNDRKHEYHKGLRKLTRRSHKLCVIRPSLYNRRGMPEVNQIICGDSIKVLHDGPEGWVDLVFADPPFNIGYDYDVYDDKREAEHYLDWTRRWGAAVRRVLKPSGAFWLAIGDE